MLEIYLKYLLKIQTLYVLKKTQGKKNFTAQNLAPAVFFS